MALYDQRFAKGVLAARWLEAHIASEQMEGVVLSGIGTGTGTGTSTGTSTTFLGRAILGSSTAALEVKNGRAKVTLEDRVITVVAYSNKRCTT